MPLLDVFIPLLADEHETFWFPKQASTFAPEIDSFFQFLLWLSVIFFVLIVVPMAYFVWKYRDRPGYKGDPRALHNTPLEITWTVIPTFIVIYIFIRGTYGYLDMARPPSDTLDINVVARKWSWQFTYPNGGVSDEMHLPINRPVRLIMRSEEAEGTYPVLHSLFVPAFRAKQDVVPGRYNVMWFNPTLEGRYDLFCTEYCGDNHSRMITKVEVSNKETFDEWVAKINQPPTEDDKHGEWLYKRLGCKGCHSVDGSKVVGPSFKGTWGKDVQFAGGKGSGSFDENYVRESILNPQAKARSGYESASAMPSYQGRVKDADIDKIIAFMKSLKD
ncbi:MAG: cytochrome c oxidase subunit II [Pirellulales bacterium]